MDKVKEVIKETPKHRCEVCGKKLASVKIDKEVIYFYDCECLEYEMD